MIMKKENHRSFLVCIIRKRMAYLYISSDTYGCPFEMKECSNRPV